MVTGLPVYNLGENPFEPRVLVPWRNRDPEDAKLFVGENGLGDLAKLETLFAEHPIAARRPMFCVVVGDPGTGRTSAANYLVYLWAKHAQVTGDSLVVHSEVVRETAEGSREAREAAEDTALYESTLSLGYEIDRRLRLLPTPKSLTEPTYDRLENHENARPGALDIALGRTIQNIDQDLKNIADPLAFAVILERLPGVGLVSRVMKVFGDCRAIIVLTANTPLQLDQLDSETAQKIGHVVKLRLLSGRDVMTVVETRWAAHSKERVPFNLSGLAEAFSYQDRTITRVLQIVSMMLEFKQVDFARDDPWPENKQRLYLDTDEIRTKLGIIEARRAGFRT